MNKEVKKKAKIDPDLKKKMREFEDKARELAMASAPVVLAKESSEDKISFDQWWILINKLGKLRPHLKEVLAVDFKSRGYSKSETRERYDEALKIFGIEI